MKIQPSLLPLLGLLAALCAPPARAADAQAEETTTSIKFTDPAKPGTLKVMLPWADVRINGTDAAELSVTSTVAQKGKAEPRADGLRRLDEEVSFELTEKDNVATLRMAGEEGWSGPQGSEFRIQVPRSTSLVLHTEMGGDVLIENVDGDIEVSSMNGEINLQNIGSSAVVNSMNGEINATFKTAPKKPVSLSSMNGEINLVLPADTKANLRLRSHNGSLLTDFPEGALKTVKSDVRGASAHSAPAAAVREAALAQREAAKAQREAAKAQREQEHAARAMADTKEAPAAPEAPEAATSIPAIPAIPALGHFGGKSIIGTLNGGGVDITLATMNGTITVRQLK